MHGFGLGEAEGQWPSGMGTGSGRWKGARATSNNTNAQQSTMWRAMLRQLLDTLLASPSHRKKHRGKAKRPQNGM